MRRLPRVAGASRGEVPGPSVMSRERGFTLLEVIVALGVLALALTLLLGTLSGATRQLREADLAARGALHAQSLLASIGTGERLLPGRRDGQFEDGRYHWELRVQPWQDPQAGPLRDAGGQQLLHLDLQVSWGAGDPRQRLDIQSLRWVRLDPAGVNPP